VEVLTDGASALYGADAIAGVVNFILKKGASPWEVNAKFNSPQKSGGKSNSFSISKGFGDYEDDGYSVFV
jgi:iron complex outermembrane receptor protein